MKTQLEQFKKIKSNNVSTTLQHPDGHTIELVHHNIRPEMKKHLDKLPLMMVHGGEAEKPLEVEKLPAEPAPPPEAPVTEQAVAPPSDPNLMQEIEQKKKELAARAIMGGGGGAFGMSNNEETERAAQEAVLTEKENEAKQTQVKQGEYAQSAEAKAAEDQAYNARAQKFGLPQRQISAAPQQPQAPTLANYTLPGGGSNEPNKPQAPQRDIYGTQAYSKNYQEGLANQASGIVGEAVAQGQMGTDQAKIENKQANALQGFQTATQARVQEIDKERMALQQDIANSHIDPQRYIHSQDAGQRVSTAIGLILGGISGGLTGQGNPAMHFLNAQIERDIASQQAELGKKQNLLAMNHQQYGDLKSATDMTRVNMLDYYASKLKEAGDKAQDPIAKARAMQAAGQLLQQAAPMVSNLAARKELLSGPSAQQVDPALKVRFLVPEKEQSVAMKELSNAQSMTAQRQNLVSIFDELSKVNTVGHNVTHPIDTHAANERAEAFLASLSKETEGRVTEADVNFLRGLMPKSGISTDELGKRRAAAINYMSQKMHFPMLDAYGIQLGNSVAARPNVNAPANYVKQTQR